LILGFIRLNIQSRTKLVSLHASVNSVSYGICAYAVYVLLIYCVSICFVFEVNEHNLEGAMKNYEGGIYAPKYFHSCNCFTLLKKRYKKRSEVFINVVQI
jgi:hypothetical protein